MTVPCCALMDLVSYNDKHNDCNCEGESGANDNNSWNHGVEGPTNNPKINALRHRQIKNAIAMLMVSQGVPMILMGNEAGRTQDGNNNAYCQDTEISWMKWQDRERHNDIYWFFKRCIEFRLAHPCLRSGHFLRGEDYQERGYPDISWHGNKVGKPNLAKNSHRLAFMLWGEYAKGGLFWDTPIYVAMNMHWEAREFELPPLPKKMAWHLFTNTGDPDHSVYEVWREPRLENQDCFPMQPRSVLILVGK